MVYEATKRLFDVVVSLTVTAILSPVLACCALAVVADSGLPVLYRGRRVGRFGRPFAMLKFRTMTVDAEKHGTTTALNDSRITRVGSFLRRYKLDELPQLFNVIRGEMSLVGPRPEVEEHTSAYDEHERTILSVLPGITDYSSIRFFRLQEILGADDPHQAFVTRYRAEKNGLRIEYVRRRSFTEDLRILGLTAWTVAKEVLGIGRRRA